MKLFGEAELLVSPEALSLIVESSGAAGSEAFVRRVIAEAQKRGLFAVEAGLARELLEAKEEEKIPVPVEVRRSPDFKPLAKEWAPDMKFLDATDITGKSKCKGTVEDFVLCFRDRLARTKKILEARGSAGLVSSRGLSGMTRGREVRVVGLVSSKRPTKKGDLLIELEDEEGITKVWIGKGRNEKERACFASAGGLLLDEVVAIDGKFNEPFVIASDIVWPDVPIRGTKTAENNVAIAFLSDLHVGSKLFLEKQFGSFMAWLNGNAPTSAGRELAGRVKYLVVAGDVVDGIGIYPKQEKELVVRDIFEQYRICGKYFESVPDYVEVIVSPGNHDAVRRAEPQPRIAGEVADAFANIANMHLIGSPSMIELEGLKTLVYHGTSLDSIIAALPGMSYSKPEKPMVELIRRRNLSPLFGENPIVPEHKDYMVIEEVPDIVHMGHVHKNGYMIYRGSLLVNSGTFQARTDFQVRMGHVPSPGVVPILETKTGKLNHISFMGAEGTGGQ